MWPSWSVQVERIIWLLLVRYTMHCDLEGPYISNEVFKVFENNLICLWWIICLHAFWVPLLTALLGQKLGLIWLLISKLAVKVLGTVNMVLCVCTLSPLKYAKKLLKLYKNFRFSVVQLQRWSIPVPTQSKTLLPSVNQYRASRWCECSLEGNFL